VVTKERDKKKVKSKKRWFGRFSVRRGDGAKGRWGEVVIGEVVSMMIKSRINKMHFC
jgi:hypothetical protein